MVPLVEQARALGTAADADHQEVVAGFGRHGLCPGDHVREVPAAEVRNHHGDRAGPTRGEPRRGWIGLVVQGVATLGDAFARRRRDVRQPAQRPADRCQADTGGDGDVFDRRATRCLAAVLSVVVSMMCPGPLPSLRV